MLMIHSAGSLFELSLNTGSILSALLMFDISPSPAEDFFLKTKISGKDSHDIVLTQHLGKVIVGDNCTEITVLNGD